MLKLTKTGIGLLTKQYRSVLKRCLIVNLCILYPLISWSYNKTGMSPISGYDLIYQYVYDRYTTSNYLSNNLDIKTSLSATSTYMHGSNFDLEQFVVDVIGGDFSYTKTQTDALLNYYYTKTEADALYEDLEDAIEEVDEKVGDLSTTGISGDVATQLKYILENGSTGGTGVSLSTLGYIGANTPYLNTTNNAMNFSSTYTIGGNMSTLANQIKTNENSISALNTRVNNLGTYGGTLELTDNYGKIMGDVSTVRNGEQLGAVGTNVKAYATLQDVNLKSYTVELNTEGNTSRNRYFRVQVNATSQEEAIKLAKDTITSSWSEETLSQYNGNWHNHINKYQYKSETLSGDEDPEIYGVSPSSLEAYNEAILATDATVTENNYTVYYHTDLYDKDYEVNVNASNPTEAIEKADQILDESWYVINDYNIYDGGYVYDNVYAKINVVSSNMYRYKPGILSTSEYTTVNGATITDGSLGTSPTYVLGNGTVIENIALLDSAIGDLGTTGVSGASVAAQLKLLGEVGSEALGQKIGSWDTTKDSISQTLGEETKRYGYLTAFEYDSENEQYVGTVSDNLTALDTALSLTAKGLDALSYDLYNYYYTFRVDEISEAAEFELFLNNEKLSNVFEA